jgi:hypothetical protein
MHRDPHLRIQRIFEDADEDGALIVPEPEEVEDVTDDCCVVLRKAWHCDCGQRNNAEWSDCVWCGADREDVDE